MGSSASTRNKTTHKIYVSSQTARSDEQTHRIPVTYKEECPSIYSFLPPVFQSARDVSQAKILQCEIIWSQLRKGKYAGFEGAKGNQLQLEPMVYFVESFNQHLFEKFPRVGSFFCNNTEKNHKKMIAAIFQFVISSRLPEKQNKKLLKKLALFHCRIGVLPQDYACFALAFLQTLRFQLGCDYSFHINEAWVCVVAHLLRNMLPFVINHISRDAYADTSQFQKTFSAHCV